MTRPIMNAIPHAPAYVAAIDLCNLVLARVEALRPMEIELWGLPAAHAARSLATEISLALTFPKGRGERLIAADRAVVELRIALRLLAHRGLASPGWHRLATSNLAAIGRMIGGWRKFEARAPPTEP